MNNEESKPVKLFQHAGRRNGASWFRLRRTSRDALAEVGAGEALPEAISEIHCRLVYRGARPGRLGDFPHIDAANGIAISTRALAVFGEALRTCFDIVPIVIDGYGVERRGTWEYPAQEEIPHDAWEEQPYVYLHAARSFVGNGLAESLGLASDPPPSSEDLVRRFEAMLSDTRSPRARVLNDLAGASPPPIFVAGLSGGFYFSVEFASLCRKHRLVGPAATEI